VEGSLETGLKADLGLAFYRNLIINRNTLIIYKINLNHKIIMNKLLTSRNVVAAGRAVFAT